MLFVEERKMKIFQYVQEHSRASVQELSQFFEVSESTVRRDLKELEEEKLLRRTHGGAIALQNVNFEPTFDEKEDKFQDEKKAIARKALEFIEEGDTILLDAGTTTFQLVKELRVFSKLTVVTNSLVFAQELQDVSGIDVVMIGGNFRKETCALVGPLAEAGLSILRVDKTFIATNGIEVEDGLTTPNLIEAATKRKMIGIAKQVILLADHSKAGKSTFAKFADIHDVDKCIIDAGVPESFVEKLRKTGVDVHIVRP
jgi:DeoR family fructose operon transcriptional repressor